jgi:hypothetical protein
MSYQVTITLKSSERFATTEQAYSLVDKWLDRLVFVDEPGAWQQIDWVVEDDR